VDTQEADRVLKRGAHRSVRRTLEQGLPAAVKRWEAGGPWRNLRARSSARREFELAGRLHALGLPVPRPIALREDEGRPELVSDWVEGRELRLCLRAGAPRALAETLGRALARAQRLGLSHADLHAGNVLVDARGDPWLVDLGGAALRASLSPAAREAALVDVCADLREHTSRSWRARALGAYLAELGEPRSAARARAIEARAQEHRREVIRHAQRRWLRDSSSCVRRRGQSGPLLASRDLDLSGSDLLELCPRSSVRARRLWLAAVRLCDHGLSCARPLLWFQGGEPLLAFGLPRHAQPAELGPALAELEPQLCDRGLSIGPGPDLRAWRGPDGRATLSGVEHIRERAGRAPWRSR